MPESKRISLWKISLQTTGEAEEAVSELLHHSLGQPVVSYTHFESALVTVSGYLAQRPDVSQLRASLIKGIREIRQCGLNPGPSKLSILKLNHTDWAESWKRHFKPIEIGPALLIKPSWSRLRTRKGQAVVVIDPGLSFGTGQHPTTFFCLKQLARLACQGRSFLDIGTGSGILAISAAKTGYAPVDAFDFDPDALRVAQANARKNRCIDKVRVFRADLTQLPADSSRRYDVICANLISSILVAHRDKILGRMEPGGVLILAGVLKTEFALVREAYEEAGLALRASHCEKEWRSGMFHAPGKAAQKPGPRARSGRSLDKKTFACGLG